MGEQFIELKKARASARFFSAPTGSPIFLRDEHGKRPVYGGTGTFQTAFHWRDRILSYEYFHGDNGARRGASHQIGWTGLAAKLIQLYGQLDAERALEMGKQAAFVHTGSAATDAKT